MPERSSAIPAWAWVVGAVLAIVSIFAGYRMVQTQQHLVTAQSELESAKQAVEKANAERNELQSKLEDATSEVGSAQSVLAETSLFWKQRKANLREPRKRLRRRTLGALKFRSNWTKPHRRPNQSNPSLRKRSLVWKQRKANLRAPSKKANRQKRKSRSSSNRRPVSTQSSKRRMGSALTSRRNWMRPDRRLSGLKGQCHGNSG